MNRRGNREGQYTKANIEPSAPIPLVVLVLPKRVDELMLNALDLHSGSLLLKISESDKFLIKCRSTEFLTVEKR
jgi:hypothetical protein